MLRKAKGQGRWEEAPRLYTGLRRHTVTSGGLTFVYDIGLNQLN